MKRRSPGEGTWYHDIARARWRYRVPVGEFKSRVFYGKTKADVQRAVADEIARAGGRLRSTPGRETLATFAERWLGDSIEPNRAAATARSYRGALETHVLPTLGRRPIAKIEPAEIETLFAELRRKKIGSRTRKNAYVVLKTLFNAARKLRVVYANPVADVDPPAHASAPVTTLSLEQIAAFLEAARGDRFFALYLLAVTTGMRQGELFGLVWAHVHLDEGYLVVMQQAVENNGAIAMSRPKTERSRRRIELSKAMVAALRGRKKAALAEGTAASPLVFCDTEGGTLRKSNFLRRSFYPMFDALNESRSRERLPGIPRVTFHSLRHSNASISLSYGISDLKSASDRLGHSSIRITADMYVHVAPATHRNEAESFDRLLSERSRERSHARTAKAAK